MEPRACRALPGLLAALTFAFPAVAADSVADLLGRLSPKAAAPATADVDVLGWVEPEQGGEQALVVTFATRGQAKLVADPGISVTPLTVDGIDWRTSSPTTRVTPGEGYFEAPPVLRLPFRADGAGRVEAHVDYAYCLIEKQCLFGERTVRVDLPRQPLVR